MRRLFRWFLRTIVSLLVLFAIVVISDYLSHRVANDSVLMVTLDGPVVERGNNGVLGLLGPRQTALNFVRDSIERGGRDKRIVGLALKILDPQMELAQAQEIADLVRGFASRGKWSAAYVESAGEAEPGNLPYIVAASASEVSLMPQGEINLVGVGVREVFARGTLDWLGVKPNFAAMGKYKSAGNVFTQKDMTPPQQEEDTGLVDSMYEQVVADAARERHLSPDAVRAIIDQAPLTAEQSIKLKLVDRLEYEDQFDERMKGHGGGHHAMQDYANYARPSMFGGIGVRDKIAVVYGVGGIERGQGGFDPLLAPAGNAMTSDQMVAAFKSAHDDNSVRAVVFRINSPGGSAMASELIRHSVEECAEKKPIVISMSSYAASGGYWVSTPANRIVAEPGTITGSIGVLGGKFNVSPAVQKIYMNTAGISRGANFEMFDTFTDFTPAQMKIFEDQQLGSTYNFFLKIVSKGRHLPIEEVSQIAEGRVWTGEQALKNKLVDELGGFDRALADAKKLANLPPEERVGLVELPEQPGLLQSLQSGRIGSTAAISGPLARMIAPMMQVLDLIARGRGSFTAAYCPVVPIM